MLIPRFDWVISAIKSVTGGGTRKSKMADLKTRVGAATGARQRHLHKGTGQQSTGSNMTEASGRHVAQCLLFIFEFPWGM